MFFENITFSENKEKVTVLSVVNNIYFVIQGFQQFLEKHSF